jgi:predicted nuclease of predicted toxin-antitoxin system
MKFIVDAQLPKKLSHFLVSKGFDSIHTLELPLRNSTPDVEIIDISERENRIVITKDSDFYDSKLLRDKPKKLIIVLTGNISNDSLINLFDNHIEKITELLIDNDIVEIEKNYIIAK